MKSLQNKYQKTAIMLKDCKTFATFTRQSDLLPIFNNEEFNQKKIEYINGDKLVKKHIINENANKIKVLKQRLKNYSYRLEIDKHPQSVKFMKIPINSDNATAAECVEKLISWATACYEHRKTNIVKQSVNTFSINSGAIRLKQHLIVVLGYYNEYEFIVTPFSLYDDILNGYWQFLDKKC